MIKNLNFICLMIWIHLYKTFFLEQYKVLEFETKKILYKYTAYIHMYMYMYIYLCTYSTCTVY